jgi:MerR family transcriptional regulator/heat shock protein HspR
MYKFFDSPSVTRSTRESDADTRAGVVTGLPADADRGLYAISVAAELTGLHPQTLRIYEREGLVSPARSHGGTRRYSPNDIDRLSEIAVMMTAGFNLVGVRRVLELQQENQRLQAIVDANRVRGPNQA